MRASCRVQAAACVQVGFFLHTPFPSSEIYRTLPYREQLLRGVLKADLIGFHTYDYVRHFISSCTRILGLEGTPYGVEENGSLIRVAAFPIGIDPLKFEATLRDPAVAEHIRYLKHRCACSTLPAARCCTVPVALCLLHLPAAPACCAVLHCACCTVPAAPACCILRGSPPRIKCVHAWLRCRYSGLKVLLGVDRLDMIKGIPQKLLAFEKFLEDHEDTRGKVVLVQIAVPSRLDVPEYQQLRSQVHEIVGRINGACRLLCA
jgi:trehalose-6-phosphate synthase